MSADQLMLHILALDPNAHVAFSTYTRQWYVSAKIDIGDGFLLEGGTQHRDTPVDAITAYFNQLAEVEHPRYLVTRYRGQRREWLWNGAAFTECTRDEALAKVSAP